MAVSLRDGYELGELLRNRSPNSNRRLADSTTIHYSLFIINYHDLSLKCTPILCYTDNGESGGNEGGIMGGYFKENEELIRAFGDYFLGKLGDRELLDSGAEKDLEKLARIAKLLFEKIEEEKESETPPLLKEVLEYFNNE